MLPRHDISAMRKLYFSWNNSGTAAWKTPSTKYGRHYSKGDPQHTHKVTVEEDAGRFSKEGWNWFLAKERVA